MSYKSGGCSFLPKCFYLHFFLCKNTLRTMSLSIWAENNRGTIEFIALEQWKNKNKFSLRKMYLTLTKQKRNSIESSADFFLVFFLFFFFHLLRSLVQSSNCFSPIQLLGIFYAWLIIYIFSMCIPQCLLALSYFSGSNLWTARVHIQRIFK